VKPSPFTLGYTIDLDEVPTEADWAQAAHVTRVYVEEFMVDEFSRTSLINLDDFLTELERKIVPPFMPRGIYKSVGLFNRLSPFRPVVTELNELLDFG
jgi:hypothetical protein